jgi:ferritin
MVDEKIEVAISNQINAELASAYLYLAMSAHFASEGLPGFARWMRLQAREEAAHAMQFLDHLLDRGGRVSLTALEQPPAGFGSALAVFERVLEHERGVTSAIHSLYELSVQERDPASQPLLLSFISEQIEEEKTAAAIVDQLRMVGEQKGPLLFLDRHMGRRQG